MEPVDYQPPLRWWSHLWRYGLVLLISGLTWAEQIPWQAENHPWWFGLDAVTGVLGCVLVWWRREHSVAVAIVTSLTASFSLSAAGPATLALVTLATRRRWREIIPIGLLSFLAGFVPLLIVPQSDPLSLLIPLAVAIIGVTIGWGMYIGSRRELLATLKDRAARAEAEQAARVAQARRAERSRIAREMHDVMAHRISLVTMHAGALAYRDDLDPATVKQTAGLIQTTSHQALAELREVLGLLREDAGDAQPERPQPSADDIAALVAEARAAGMSIRFEPSTSLPELHDSVGRTLYRIVQESLTNARKHAPGTTVTIRLSEVPGDHLTAVISNPLAFGRPAATSLPASGLGLVGLSERAALAGGRLTHRLSPDGTFIVEAWLPWPT